MKKPFVQFTKKSNAKGEVGQFSRVRKIFKERMQDVSSPQSERVRINNDKQVASIVVSREDNLFHDNVSVSILVGLF